MSESTMERHDSPENNGQERAHRWVATLTETMLAYDDEAGNHVEYTLNTDQENATELLHTMRVGDLLFTPGTTVGEVMYAEFYDDTGFQDKMGLTYGNSFVIPPEPTRIFISAVHIPADAGGKGMHSIGIGFEYARGNSVYRQITGLVANPDHTVTAICIANGQSGGRTVMEDERSRPQNVTDTREFIESMQDLLAVVRNRIYKI